MNCHVSLSDMSQAAIAFEAKYGFSGIAGHYVFPDEPGTDCTSMQERLYTLSSTRGTPRRQELLREYANRYARLTGTSPLSEADIRAGGELARKFEQWADKELQNEYKSMLTRLTALNPELTDAIRFDADDIKHVYDVLVGVVSGFNPDDINYYLHDYKYKQDSPQNKERRQLEEAVLTKLDATDDHTLGWIASPGTLHKIEQQLQDRPLQVAGTQSMPRW